MSSSSETGVLRVSATLPGTRFGLLDAGGAKVRTGADHLNVQVRAGVYDVIADRAGVHARQLVRVRPGAPRNERVDLDVPGSPIVTGSVSFDAAAAEAVASLGTRPHGVASPVIIVLGPGLSARRPRRPAVRLTDVDTGRPVRLRSTRHGDVTIAKASPAAGGYLLTTSWRDAANAVVTIQQTLWLVRGWQTIVALPADPHGAYAERASMHLVPTGVAWDPGARAHQLTELVLAELRSGHPHLTQGVVDEAADASGRGAPMLPLYVAQMALLQRDPESVARMIDQLPPEFADHPDVRAMNVSLERTVHAGRTAKCPPTLAASYFEALLPADAVHPHTIPVGSLAEHVSASALPGGPWLQWLPTERHAPTVAAVVTAVHGPARPARRAAGVGLRGVLGRPGGARFTVLGGALGNMRNISRLGPGFGRGRSGFPSPADLRDLGRTLVRRQPLRATQLSPAAQRVALYVTALAQRRGVSDGEAIADLGVAELARRLTMPRSLVESAVRELSVGLASVMPKHVQLTVSGDDASPGH